MIRSNGHKQIAIGELCALVNGRAFKPSEWAESGLPIVRIQNLNDETASFNYFQGEYDPRHEVNTGDLLFSWSGTPGTSFGAFFWNRGKGVLNQHIFNVLTKPEFVERPYFRYVLNHRLDKIIDQSHGGVGLKHITKGKLEAITVPLPPLAEQRRIAAVLDAAEALRAKRSAALAKLDSLTQSIFLEMFGDPVRNERNWPTATVADICNLVRGSSPRPQGDPLYFGGPVPRLMIADITRDGWHVTPRIDSLTIEGAKRSRPVPAGTVVMAVSGNIGLVARLAVDACVHDGFVAFTGLDESRLEPGFLLNLLHLSKTAHEQNKAGAIFINLTTTDIKRMPMPLPPMKLQHDFMQRAAKVDKLVDSHRRSLASIDGLIASIQHRAFRGEL